MSVVSESLLDAQRRELAQFVQKGRSLRHELVHERQSVLRLLADERAEARGAQKERFTFIVGSRVGGIARVLRQAFGAERLAGRRDPRNESAAARTLLRNTTRPRVTTNTPSATRTALIDRETRRPRCACRICSERLSLGVSQSREPQYSFSPTTILTSRNGG